MRRQIYPGIDVSYHPAREQGLALTPLEYDYIIQPGANPNVIRLRFRVGTRLAILQDGSLDVEVDGSHLRQRAPVAYTENDSERTPVEAHFRKHGDREIGFVVGSYDRRRVLTIDPEISSVDVFGGTGDDEVTAAQMAGSTSTAIAGATSSPDFPGAEPGVPRGRDVFVQFKNVNGTKTLLLGGSGDDRALGVTFSDAGVLVAGETTSRDLPVTSGRGLIQSEYGGGESDGFLLLVPIVPNQNQQLFLTYFGGSGVDRIKIVRSESPLIIVAGETNSTDLPGMRASESRPFGQMDVFVWVDRISLNSDNTFQPGSMTLLGGSGNDFLKGVQLTGGGVTGVLHVLGETESGDFPLIDSPPGTLRGPSDAFWVGLPMRYPNPMLPRFSRTYGGLGRDRFVSLLSPSLALADQNWVLTGETTSPDLPDGGAAIRTYAGGIDLMALWFDPASSAFKRRAYFGGSGDERLLSSSWYGDLVTLAGVTNSTDLPLMDAFQSRYGGGATDGLLVQLRSSGDVALASYFGGDRSDGITSVCFYCASLNPERPSISFPLLSLIGVTDSTSWPATAVVDAAPLPGSHGGFDYFQASVLLSRVPYTGDVLLARGIFAPLYLSPPIDPELGTTATFTVEDPSLVQVSTLANTASGSARLTVDAPAAQHTPLWVYAIADRGETRIRLDMPGLPPQFYRVRIGALEARLRVFNVNEPPSVSLQEEGFIWATPSLVFVINGVENGANLRAYQFGERSSPLVYRLESLTPEVLAFTDQYGESMASVINVFYDDTNRPPIYVRARQPGLARVRVSVPNTEVAPTEWSGEIRSRAPVSIPPTLGARRVIQVAIQLTSASAVTRTVRLTSSDPSVVGLSASPIDPVSGDLSVAIPAGQSQGRAYLHGVANAGEATIGSSVVGQARFDFPVRILPAVAVLRPGVVCNIHLGSEVSTGTIELAHRDPNSGDVTPPIGDLRPGPPISVTLRVSDPSILRLRYQNIVFDDLGSPKGVTVTGLKSGLAAVEIASASGAGLVPGQRVMEIRVRDHQWTPPLLILGQNLEGTFSFPSPWPIPSIPRNIRISSTDPSRMLLSATSATPVQASIDTFGSFPNTLTFVAHGLASAGDVSLRLETDGQDAVLIPVRLSPAGVLFGQGELTARVGTSTTVSLSYHPIDPATLLPGPAQRWRRGVAAPAIQLTLDDPAIASHSTAQAGVTVSALRPGIATFTISQPAGLLPARVHNRLLVRVLPGQFGLFPVTLGTNLQAPASLRSAPRIGVWTLTSTQPDKLVLSSSLDRLGSAEMTLNFAASPTPGIYLQALGTPGFVWVLARAPGFEDDRFYVRILPSTWRWLGPDRVTLSPQQQDHRLTALLTTIAPPGIDGFLGTSTVARPGLGPLQLSASVADPTKIRLRDTAVEIGPTTTTVDFFLSAIAPGATEVILNPPPAFLPPGSLGRIALTVEGPPGTSPPLRFVAVTPCRVADTRVAEGKVGAFGPPRMQGGQTREFPIPSGACGIPSSARAYSLNVTVVPGGPLAYLTIWPAGVARPLVSTLNSFEGRVVANAALVPSGTNGAINVFVTNDADVILDINGYFVP